MKHLFFISTILMLNTTLKSQQLYVDFEGTKMVRFGPATGVVDSLTTNPFMDSVNTSLHCAKYIRGKNPYDNFKLYTDTTLQNVSDYEDNSAAAPKISMKLYSSAPVGTPIILQLGKMSDDTYPSGVHSEYIAQTTVQNAWQDIVFNYFQTPTGSFTLPTQVNKVVILFHPNSDVHDTIYFDDLKGPAMIENISSIHEADQSLAFKLFQNSPNPAKNYTHINFQIDSPGLVSLELFDLLGNSVSSILNQRMKAGSYSVPFDTENIPNGVYFYVLKKEGNSRSLKMIISK